MKNFLRAFRFAWNYRFRLFASVLCAMIAAVFWGLNFPAIYPVLKIIGSDKNLQQWVDREIQRTRKEIRNCETNVHDMTRHQHEVEALAPSQERSHQLRDIARDLAQV